MGYIKPEIYQSLVKDKNRSIPEIFIETGTFKGGVPLRMLEEDGSLDPFKKLYTVELGYDICQIASRRYQLFENGTPESSILHTNDQDTEFIYHSWQEYFDGKLTLCHGDSANELEPILKIVDQPACFWLDAHSGAQQYARGEKDVPLLLELEIIKSHHIKDHIIAIDDAHLFGKIQYDKQGNIICDYSDVTFDVVKEKLLEINPSYDVGLYAPYDMQMILAI